MRALWNISIVVALTVFVGCHNPCTENPSCSIDDPECQIDYGFCVAESASITTGEVREVFDITASAFTEEYGLPLRSVREETIELLDGYVVRPEDPSKTVPHNDRCLLSHYPDNCFRGLFDEDNKRLSFTVRDGMCLANTALSHEFIHAFLAARFGDPDASHSATRAWALEWATRADVADAFCPWCVRSHLDGDQAECVY